MADNEKRDYEGHNALNARMDGMDKATTLKATEIDRRLYEANQLRKELITDRSQFLRESLYIEHVKALDKWRTEVNEALTKLMTPYERQPGRPDWTAVVVVAIGILNLFVLVLHYMRG